VTGKLFAVLCQIWAGQRFAALPPVARLEGCIFDRVISCKYSLHCVIAMCIFKNVTADYLVTAFHVMCVIMNVIKSDNTLLGVEPYPSLSFLHIFQLSSKYVLKQECKSKHA